MIWSANGKGMTVGRDNHGHDKRNGIERGSPSPPMGEWKGDGRIAGQRRERTGGGEDGRGGERGRRTK